MAIQSPLPVIASEAWQSSTPGIEFGGPFYPSDHPEHQIWGSVLPFRPPWASNLGVRFTLPTTLGIEFGGPFYPSDHPGHQIWGAFSPFRQLGSQIWGSFLHHRPARHPNLGSFLHHRPARHPNLGVKLPVPRKLHTPLLPKPTNQSESPHLFFATPRGYHRESSTKRSGDQERNAEHSGNFAPLPRFLFTFKLHFLL